MSSEASQLLHCTLGEDSSSGEFASNSTEALLPFLVGVFGLSRSGRWPCLCLSFGCTFTVGFIGVGDVEFSFLHGLVRRTLVHLELLEEVLDEVANV